MYYDLNQVRTYRKEIGRKYKIFTLVTLGVGVIGDFISYVLYLLPFPKFLNDHI